MGRLSRFNLDKLRSQTSAEFFFETGTWRGDGVAYASRSAFKKLYSSEIVSSVASRATERFKNDDRVNIINASSIDALNRILPDLNGNCIFWLDAHFPGAEEGLNDYNEFADETVKLPLEKELDMIATRNNTYQDVILIDDLRIYEEGDFQNGNLPANVLPPKIRNIRFAENLFEKTHIIKRSLIDEGYLLLLPKKLKSLPIAKASVFAIENLLTRKVI